jgi:hypothetical protein
MAPWDFGKLLLLLLLLEEADTADVRLSRSATCSPARNLKPLLDLDADMIEWTELNYIYFGATVVATSYDSLSLLAMIMGRNQ